MASPLTAIHSDKNRVCRRRATGSKSKEMEHIGAGLAAMGVIGPGIGIGILTGMSTAAIGRNPDAAAQSAVRSSSSPRSPKASACWRSSSAC